MKRIIILILAAIFATACPSTVQNWLVSPESISEIGISGHTGLGNSGFEFLLRRDGKAQFKCTFYDVTEEPEADSMQVKMIQQCGEFFKNKRAAFQKIPTSVGGTSRTNLEGVFSGQVSPEQFDKLAQLMVKNGYFSLSEEYYVSGLMDAPPTHTWAVYASGKKKEVRSQQDKGGAKLDEIEDEIYGMASEIAWQ